MGCVANIDYTAFPKQLKKRKFGVGSKVKVGFHFDTEHVVSGRIVRRDNEAPWVTIIKLEDGRLVLDTECQYYVEAKSKL